MHKSKKYTLWFVAVLMTVFMYGCGEGNGKWSAAGGAADTTRPTVTAVTPLNNATGVAINRNVTATFSEAMDAATISTSTFSLACPAGTPVTGVVTYVASSKAATFNPTGNLPVSTVCTATITTGAKDVAGNALASSFIWTFTTGVTTDTTAPTVSSTVPATGATGVATNTQITATFSEDMDPATISGTTFTLVNTTLGGTAVAGNVTYSVGSKTAIFTPTSPATLPASTLFTGTITTGVKDLADNAMTANYTWTFTTGAASDTTAPTITSKNPADGATGICTNKLINATFSEAMDPTTITTATFTVSGVVGTVAYDAPTMVATFTPVTPATLAANTLYTVTMTNEVKDVAGNALAANNVWSFTTGTSTCTAPVSLGSAAPFGGIGGNAGLTNEGDSTVVNGDVGTTAASTLITGFHDTGGNTYTETCPTGGAAVGCGLVNGTIHTATAPPGSSPGVIAAAALLDANTAYTNLSPAALPGGIDVSTLGGGAGELGSRTLAPGIYKSAPGTFAISTGDLTLDGGGDANAVWVFQMASSLTVGIAGPTGARSVILTNGAQAKNVFWQVGSAATINGAGGGTMVGTIIASSGVTFSTSGNTTLTTLNGRALGLNASVTMVNTVINVPAP